jgi:hypothetical protein
MHEVRPYPSGYGRYLVTCGLGLNSGLEGACDGAFGVLLNLPQMGLAAEYDVTNRGTFTSIDGSAVLPARGLILADTRFAHLFSKAL